MDSIKLCTAGCSLVAELLFPAAAMGAAAGAAAAGGIAAGAIALAGEAAAPGADGVVTALHEEKRRDT